MNKQIVFFALTCTVLGLNAHAAQNSAGPRSTTEAIAAQATQESGDIYRGTVFGSDQKAYTGGTTLGNYKTATKKYVYDTSLIRAIKISDPDRVRTLMYAHVDVNEKNYAGITPLTVAAEKGNMEIIKMLVEDGKADVNDKSSYGVTPIISASAAGQGEVIEYLVSKGANVTVKDDMGKTPLLYAVHFDQPKAIESLIKFDNAAINLPDNSGNAPLIYAAQEGLLNNVKALLTYGADVNYRNPVSGLSALAAAAAEGHTQVIRALVKNGKADINLPDQSGRTPIFYAAEQNQTEALRTLISLGADVNAQDLSGATLLMLTAAKNQQDCFNLLLRQKSTDLAIQDLQGRSAITYSAYANDTYPAQKLLTAGADINERDIAGNTPLLAAIKAKNEHMALFFIQQGADLTLANNQGENAFTLTEKFLPNSSLANVLNVKRASAEQQMLQVQAQRLAEVRSLEAELAQDEEVARQLAAEKEAQERQLAEEKEAAVRAKVEQEYQERTAQLDDDPELQQLQQQLEAARAKKQAALQQEIDQRVAQELGEPVANTQASVQAQVAQTKPANTKTQTKVVQTQKTVQQKTTTTRNTVRRRTGTTTR